MVSLSMPAASMPNYRPRPQRNPAWKARLPISWPNQALGLARLWRRLAEMGTWRPLADAGSVREALQSLGCRVLPDAEIADWMALVAEEQGPPLIRVGRAARDWQNRPGIQRHDTGGIFLAA